MENLRASKGFAPHAAFPFNAVGRNYAAVLLAAGLVACGGEADNTGNAVASGGPSAVVTPGTTAGPGVTPATSVGLPGTSTGAAPTPPAPPPPQLGNLDTKTSCPTSVLNAAPLRRLTRGEYVSTVRSLFGFDLDVGKNLPPDEVEKNGFSNSAAALTYSDAHVRKNVEASETLAKEAVKNLTTLAPCTASTTEPGATQCAKDFIRSFGRRAFRRQITDQDEQMLLKPYAVGYSGGGYAGGIEVTIRAMLQSPDFIYRLELTQPADANAKLVALNGFEMATRLSYTFWGTTPDNALLDAAQAGTLGSKEQVAATARKMLADPKARAGLTEFYNQWLTTNRVPDITKDSAAFPLFTADARAGMAAELDSFVDFVMGPKGDHKLTTLLTANVAFPTKGLAPVYAAQAAGTTPQMLAPVDTQGRAGLLTLPAFLSVMAHPDQTSPVLRGAFIRAKLLCDPPKPPPDNVDITPPEPKERPTARERLSAHLEAGGSCNGCHALMDPIGFAFENFDAIGVYRDKENNVTIDASGEILGTPGLEGGFVGVRGLANKLAANDAVRDCVATQWFRYASGRYENSGDSCTLATMQETFTKTDGDLVELLVQLTQTDAFMNRAKVEVTP